MNEPPRRQDRQEKILRIIVDILFALIISFILLLISVIKGYEVALPLLFSLGILIVTLARRGFSVKALIAMGFASSQKSFSVISILLMIGAVTAVWMAAGTIPALVYYGTQLISPRYFILSAFILTSFTSVLLGTSFGTVSTVGVALMIMAKGGNGNPHLVAGAIVAGAYFGDRCSPMSSSANLVASITKTKLYKNINQMIVTAWLPLITSILLYLFFSLSNPVEMTDNTLVAEIPKFFKINFLVSLPALAILVLSFLQVEVKSSLLLSVVISITIGMFVQGHSLLQLIKFSLLGFNLESASDLASVFTGGGIFSMLRISVVVILSTALAGIITGTRVLKVVDSLINKTSSRSNLFLVTTIVSLASATFGCTQAIAIIMTQQLMNDKYEHQLDNYQLAIDIENTAVVLSPLIPWNIAGLVPATILMTDSGFILYSFYLYLLPLFNLIHFKLNDTNTAH